MKTGFLRNVSRCMIAACFVTPLATADDDSAEIQELKGALVSINKVISDTPSQYHHARAEIHFRLESYQEAITDYDTAVTYNWPHDDNSCWERGLAQYYVGDYISGAEQFLRYHRVGALDIENGLWRFLCIAEEEGIEKARESILEYPRQVRKPFPALLALYMGKGSAEAVLSEAALGVDSDGDRNTNLFNAHYYLAKFYEITDQNDLVSEHIRKALDHKIPHFMYACAQADAKRIAAKQP
jgi:lipoprotein NlpI